MHHKNKNKVWFGLVGHMVWDCLETTLSWSMDLSDWWSSPIVSPSLSSPLFWLAHQFRDHFGSTCRTNWAHATKLLPPNAFNRRAEYFRVPAPLPPCSLTFTYRLKIPISAKGVFGDEHRIDDDPQAAVAGQSHYAVAASPLAVCPALNAADTAESPEGEGRKYNKWSSAEMEINEQHSGPPLR